MPHAGRRRLSTAHGPTHPLRQEMVVGGESVRYRLRRSEESVRDLRVAIPSPDPGVTDRALWRRYSKGEEFTVAPMTPQTDDDGREVLVAPLPAPPAAGKLE
ncbi:MAG TPA: hypothetical protein VLA36_10255 [Longimicrobiales bacterium]|nr:hypothetical protein [Longimicrobiales bacterium]